MRRLFRPLALAAVPLFAASLPAQEAAPETLEPKGGREPQREAQEPHKREQEDPKPDLAEKPGPNSRSDAADEPQEPQNEQGEPEPDKSQNADAIFTELITQVALDALRQDQLRQASHEAARDLLARTFEDEHMPQRVAELLSLSVVNDTTVRATSHQVRSILQKDWPRQRMHRILLNRVLPFQQRNFTWAAKKGMMTAAAYESMRRNASWWLLRPDAGVIKGVQKTKAWLAGPSCHRQMHGAMLAAMHNALDGDNLYNRAKRNLLASLVAQAAEHAAEVERSLDRAAAVSAAQHQLATATLRDEEEEEEDDEDDEEVEEDEEEDEDGREGSG